MAALAIDAEIIENVLSDRACYYATKDGVRTVMAFDRERGQFLLIDEGWSGYQRIHHIWAHIEVQNGKFLVHEDGTEEGLANLLVTAGIAPDHIVLAFQAPCLRFATNFAAA